MLKFQNNNTTFSVNFEDFILIVFVIKTVYNYGNNVIRKIYMFGRSVTVNAILTVIWIYGRATENGGSGSGGMIYMSQAVQDLIEQYIYEIKKIYGSHLRKVILYGSYAFKSSSDKSSNIIMSTSEFVPKSPLA